MQFSNDNSNWSTAEAYATSKSWSLASGDGTKTVYAKFSDVAGNWSNAVSNTITLDTTPPSQPTINTVTSPTNTNSQTITGTKSTDAVSIVVTCSTATIGTVTYPTSTTWSCPLTNLTEGNNSISVTAQDAAGNQSAAATDGIFLNTAPPPSQPTINTVSSPTTVNSQTISGTKSTDATSIIVTCTTSTVGTVSYPTNTSWSCQLTSLTEGVNSITAIAQNSTGGQSTPATTSILLDTTAPAGTITINSGAQNTNSPFVTLNLSATDSGSGLSQMRFSNDGTNWSTAEAYATSKSWTLATGDGTKTVYAKFKDVVGNWSNPVSHTIILDTVAPVIAITSPANNFVATTQTIDVSGTINDNQATVTVNGVVATVSNGTFTANSVTLNVGQNTVTATAINSMENSTSASITVTCQPAVTLSITITSPANNTLVNTSTISVSGTVTDATASVTVNSISATITDNTFTATSVPLTEGANIITARAVKGTSTAQATINVKSDTTPPSIAISTPDNSSTTRSNIVSGRVSDDTQTVTVNGTTAELLSDFRFIARPALTEGANTITVQATDNAGNSNQSSVTITYNTQTPKVTITLPLDNSEQDISPINVQGTNTTGLLSILVNFSTALINNTNFTAQTVSLTSLKTVITASGYDANNNQFSDSILVTSPALDNYNLIKVSGDVTQGDPSCPAAGSNQILKVQLNNNDQPAPNKEIQFSITQGNGTLSSASSFTDANGQAQLTLTTDTSSTIINQVDCYPTNNPLLKATFSVASKPAQPSVLTKITDDSIAPVAGVTMPLIVKLTDLNNNPIEGETINFQVTQGIGTISSTVVATTEFGEAKVNLTCPTLASSLTQIQVSSNTNSLISATFNITTSASLTVTADDIIAKVNLNDSYIQDIKADITVTSDAPFLTPITQLKIWIKGNKQKVQEISPNPGVYIRPVIEGNVATMSKEIVSGDPTSNIYVVKIKKEGQTDEYPCIINYIDYSKGIILKTEYHISQGDFETTNISEYSDFVQIGNAWGYQSEVDKVYGGDSKLLYTTTRAYSNIQINTGIPDSEFQ